MSKHTKHHHSHTALAANSFRIDSFLQSLSRLPAGTPLRTKPNILALIAETKACIAERHGDEMIPSVKKKLTKLRAELKNALWAEKAEKAKIKHLSKV